MATQPVFAQDVQTAKWSGRDMTYRGQSYDVLDSSYVPGFRMKQHRKFMNHQYAFPARPRNMWEIGIGGGLYNVSGDVPTLMAWQSKKFRSMGFDVHVRKAWGYVFSTRLQYIYGVANGLQWQESRNYRWNPAWKDYYNAAILENLNQPTDPVFYNYRMEAHHLNLDFIASLNNIKFHKARTGISVYAFLGLGALAYNTRVNALDDNSATHKYDFYKIVGFNNFTPEVHENHRDIQKKLQDGMDDTYETDAENERDHRRPSIFKNKTLQFAPSFGLGMQIRCSKRINISIEDRVTMPWDDDLLDGQRWSEQVYGSPVQTNQNDGINYLSVGINFNLGNKRKNVEPLYWLNPLDHSYNELTYPRHMLLPDPILPDADGDGITDQFDKCPGTPMGVAVDSHGCPLDTDGDGVPDDRDKQLITPTECQPVDADGVGKCPCPEGCGTVASSCGNIGAGSITFDNNASKIRPAAQAQLATLAAQMQANPTCKVVVTGAGNGSKVQQQRSWDRVNAVIEYMSEKHGIDRNKFIFQYGTAGDANSVMYRSAMPGEEGPANVAPPFPNLRRD
ncbi:MAG: OmpA family protein [Bacteroidetes bacterium]|nr:OmpA family protein [Bacteroidota bacterium]